MSERLSKIQHFFLSHGLGGMEKLLFLSIVLTCLALVTENAFIKTRLILKPGDPNFVFLNDDRISNGSSTSEWIDQNTYEWRCTLRQQYAYPYCQFHIQFDGIDLSRYETLTISLEYSGAQTSSDSIRITLLSNIPRYSKDMPEGTLKPSEIEIPTLFLDQPFVARTGDFKVPDWWLRQYNILPQNVHAEYDDVAYVTVMSGTGSLPGDYTFKLNYIQWEGNLIPPEQWYYGIIIGWLVFNFGVLIYRVWHLKSEIDEHYAHAQDLQRLNRMLDIKSRHFEKMARTDPLTGISNRAGIGGILVDEIRNHTKNGNPLSVIMLDIDHFKSVNDNHGHDYGDEILIKVARTLTDTVRSSDAVARWGGEEFILVCPNTPLDKGMALAEKLRLRIKLLSSGAKSPISASFGVAMLGDESVDELVKRVDEALYKAKQNGRDRVEASKG
jgi:diguanylate cyclase (GGDEF)-like protein